MRQLSAKNILALLRKYPTPTQIARARLPSLEATARLKTETACRLHEAAKTTLGSRTGPVAEAMVRTLVDQVRFSQKLKDQYEPLLIETYRSLPMANHRDTINGIGEVTAAVLTAKIVSIERCDRPEQVVGYFGIFPEEKSSGIGPEGALRPGPKTRMSKKGNDLVRSYLYNASMSAVQCNPAVRALYRRLRARGTTGKAALGHAMRKLLHLVFAVWKSGKPFDPQHYPWDQTAEEKEAAGHKQETSPDQQVVTATPSQTLNRTKSAVNNSPSGVDFQAVRSQTSIEQVLELLKFEPVETRGDQVRGACPVHGSTSPRSRSFSASLTKNTYRSFQCPSQGNHLDVTVHSLSCVFVENWSSRRSRFWRWFLHESGTDAFDNSGGAGCREDACGAGVREGVVGADRIAGKRGSGVEAAVGADPRELVAASVESASPCKTKPRKKPSGKKRGGQPGHERHQRTLVPPEQVTKTIRLKPLTCPHFLYQGL
ncbi:MAG: transposase [Planctomycetes bacterium]|nr:transposase [Planctomycetota bacterium]